MTNYQLETETEFPALSADEAKERAANQLAGRIADLDYRAAALGKFLHALEACPNVTPAWVRQTAQRTGTWYDDDHMVEAIAELMQEH
jgi:hypothetical protein